MGTSRDVQEIVEKLSSDKAKAREEGIKLLNTWLEGERSIGFCKYLAEKTANLKLNEIPQSETWPFLVKLLIQSVSLEISASRRRSPKLIFAKTLRIVVQRAEDSKLLARVPPLLSIAKTLFSHIWDVLSNIPSFQSEYGIILRHLLASKAYHFHIKKQVYSNFLFLYMEKVEASLREKSSLQYNPKEEVFRSVLTLQSLLENPPGDFPGNFRGDIVKYFVQIFSHVRDEGKVSRKLIECVNTYLSKDGPNLGCQSLEIHASMQQFVYHCWGTTHDKGLKDALIFYARVQLSLIRGSADKSHLGEQFLNVVCKELDQGCLPIPSASRSDMTKDDKFGVLSSSQSGLADLAALLLYQACTHSNKAASTEKRFRKDHPAAYLKEALGKGKWLWSVAFCSLVRNYKTRIRLDLFIYWFDGIFKNFERIMNDANIGHAYDGLLWTLRSLQELSTVLLLSDYQLDKSSGFKDVSCGWQSVWSCLMHGLPIFSNVTPVVDAALVLLGSIVSHNLVNTCVVTQDVWDLWLFKGSLSLSVLYFTACYFSWKGSQGDFQDTLHLRRNLLKAMLSSLSWKDSLKLNEQLVLLLPAAVYALCTGCAPFAYRYEELAFWLSYGDATEAADDRFKTKELVGHESHLELFDCCVEVLSKLDPVSNFEHSSIHYHEVICLPRQFSEPLLRELETYFLVDKLTEKKPLSDVFLLCAFLLNLLDGSLLTRKQEDCASFISHLGYCLLELLNDAVNAIQCQKDSRAVGSSGFLFGFSETNDVVASFRSFISCPFFAKPYDQRKFDALFYDGVITSLENVLKAFGILYGQYIEFLRNLQSEERLSELSAIESPMHSIDALDGNRSIILDMELDLNEDTKDIFGAGGKNTNWMFSVLECKMGMVAFISSFFPVLHAATWDVLCHLLENENDPKVCETIVYSLCQHPHKSSSELLDMVSLVDNILRRQVSLKLDCINVVASICDLLGALLSANGVKVTHDRLRLEIGDNQFLQQLGELVIRVSEYVLLDWFGRVKLVECICNFILLRPEVGQTMIEKLLLMLQDADYRVRCFLGRQIGVLFQTWDGHEELFQDICSNFGLTLVVYSKRKLVTVKEVLAAGTQDRLKVETVIIALMHLALHSERIELEAVFMMCAVSAIEPSQRELVNAALDNLSQRLQYESRTKYLEELIGAILFCWVACGISIAALVEIRHFFLMDAEPSIFIQYCCDWLLPALSLQGDNSTLSWIAKIAGQSLGSMIKDHFVPMFSICMMLHCSKRDGWEKGALVLQSSILHLAEISENERDKLIKKHMVSIVSHIFSLASCSSDLPIPYFSKDAVACAIQTVVDGFLEVDHPMSINIVDKINIFRPDRVFMFIVEMHYRIAAAVHHRHKSHRLASVEVLVSILRHRAAIPSTYSYLFNLIGQLIDCHALQDQCCRIISVLLETYNINISHEVVNVLGEQLPFLVSKLVACCIRTEAVGQSSACGSSEVLRLLLQLTVDSDPSFHDYIRELETFPELHMFKGIRRFHQELCQEYSSRDHLLRFAKRAPYLPSRLVSLSLQVLHNKLPIKHTCQREKDAEAPLVGGYWQGDLEVLDAVWTLVRLCSSNDATSVRSLVSDLISRVGIQDPHSVVFHLPGERSHLHVCQHHVAEMENNLLTDCAVSEELLVALLKVLKKYLLDDSVKIVDTTAQTLRGILATERGHRAMSALDTNERSVIEVHSKGINVEFVEKLLMDLEVKYKATGISVEQSAIWTTHDKNFQMWICPLVYALISHCNDLILRLCQDIVLVKAEVAELLLPSIIVNLAGKMDMNVSFHGLLSSQVQEHIFTESNRLIKSIQVFLNALNELRLCFVMEWSLGSSLRESSKSSRPRSYSSKSHSLSTKARDSEVKSNQIGTSTVSWNKVFWLSIDYLAVARSAIACGSFFTSVMYVEQWCEEHFKNLTLGSPDFSDIEKLPHHIEILISAITHINEPDSLYGIIQSHTLTSQIITYEHEGDWNKALEYYDLQVRSKAIEEMTDARQNTSADLSQSSIFMLEDERKRRNSYKGLIRSLQKIGSTHLLDMYCQGLSSQMGLVQNDLEFRELQYEAAWRAGNWDFSMLEMTEATSEQVGSHHFNEHLHSCLRALREGERDEFLSKLKKSKEELVRFVSDASEESTEIIYSSIIRLQILYHLGIAWDIRWASSSSENMKIQEKRKVFSDPLIPTAEQLYGLNSDWSSILERLQLHMNLLEPFMAFRRVLLKILRCNECTIQHLLQSASTLRKGSRFTQAAAALHEFKFLCLGTETEYSASYWLGRLEEAKLLRAQGQHEMAISLAKYVSQCFQSNEVSSDVYRLVGKWLAETRSSNSKTILEKFLKPAVSMAENQKTTNKKSLEKQSQTHFRLAHYTDALFRSYEQRLSSNEWQAAMRLRKHKTLELEALIRQLKGSRKAEKTDYSLKIQELQKQLSMDKEETEKILEDRDNFLSLALEGYKRCLVIGDKYDVRVVFRLVSLWFSLTSRQTVVNSMLETINEVQSYKFVPLVYQIASRMGGSKDAQGTNFQHALISLVKKMAIDHPYHTILQLLALANGDRVKDKQRSRSSFVVDMDKKHAAEHLLQELSTYHGPIIGQMRQMVEVYIKLAELETKREDKRVTLPRDIRSLRQLELVPVVTATVPVDHSCQYHEGSFPYFKGLADSITVMNGINAPKVVECLGSDGHRYKQLAKSGNDDLRQDAVMEQFFGLVNTFLQNHQDTWKRRLAVRTYKVVPFTPSAGVLEWVDGTVPLGDYLTGSSKNGGAHGRYGMGDWSFMKCREHMSNEKDKQKAFKDVCQNFRPVMHHFFLERFLRPADWFEKRLAFARSVAATSMVGYIVGLGDRHAMNILIDQATAEVVHIDLGVAFEQGLMLKTPERVPFRLTRDMVDGMGVTGVEGVFRRCCEETLSVMRTNKEALLTIIEVFIHDPLYKWALSPLKALQRQKEPEDDLETNLEESEDEYEGNKDAARAMMRVKQKLDGYEEGELRSIHGQVQQLIQDAIAPERLCHMFPGWGAWM